MTATTMIGLPIRTPHVAVLHELASSPVDYRQRLRWELERADEAADRGRQRRARTLSVVDPEDDPRNLLGKL